MADIRISVTKLNAQLLNEELRDAFGSALVGISTGKEQGENILLIHFAGDAEPEDAQRAHDIVQAHNPSAKSRAEEALERRAARLTEVDALKEAVMALDFNARWSAAEQESVLKFLLARALATD